MLPRILILILAAGPALSAADKTTEQLLEVLRELGGIQDQMKGLQKSLEGKLGDLSQSNADQLRAATDQTAKAIAALGDRFQKSLTDSQNQQAKTLDAVAGVSSRLDGVSNDLGTMRQAVSDLTASLARLSTQMDDLSAAVKALQPPPATMAPQPVLNATDLFTNAEADYLGGKLDLALQEYSDYVAKFGDTPQAADAQYRIGSIHYSNQEWDAAVKAFDLVIQNYSDNKRVPAAMYYKADSLARLGRSSDAADVLKDLQKRFPNDPMAKRSLTIKP